MTAPSDRTTPRHALHQLIRTRRDAVSGIVMVQRIEPGLPFTRVTLCGALLDRDLALHPADAIKLFLPGEPQAPVPAPTYDSTGTLIWPADRPRPHARCFTVAAVEDDHTLAIDVLVRDEGCVTEWLHNARTGDQLGFTGFRSEYADASPPGPQLLIGDRSAVPALRSIITGLSAGAPTTVLTDADPSWLQTFPSTGCYIRGNLDDLVAATGALGALAPETRAWVAAEHSVAARIRSVLLDNFGAHPDQVAAKSYWQRGLSWEAMFDASLVRFHAARASGADVTDPGILQQWEFEHPHG